MYPTVLASALATMLADTALPGTEPWQRAMLDIHHRRHRARSAPPAPPRTNPKRAAQKAQRRARARTRKARKG